MMSTNESQKYIIRKNEELEEEIKKLRIENRDLEEELDSCGKDEKRINDLRCLLHNLTSINENYKKMVSIYENQRKSTIDYIKDYNLSSFLHKTSMKIFILLAFFFNYYFVHAIVCIAIIESYISSHCLQKFEKNLKNDFGKLFEIKTICKEEEKNLEIFDRLIDTV